MKKSFNGMFGQQKSIYLLNFMLKSKRLSNDDQVILNECMDLIYTPSK